MGKNVRDEAPDVKAAVRYLNLVRLDLRYAEDAVHDIKEGPGRALHNV